MNRKQLLRGLLATPLALLSGLLPGRRSRAATSVRAARPTKPWQAVEFEFDDGRRTFPGIAVLVPGGEGRPDDVYTACRLCPHEGCTFGYEANYPLVGQIIGRPLANPVLLCRCHLSVFDPARDGLVISGPAKRPPWRFEVREAGEAIEIIGVEPGAGEIK